MSFSLLYMGRMKHRIETFADIIHPVSEEEFFAEYYDRKPLHVPAPDPDKFAEIMSWQKLSHILNMTAAWSDNSLQLYLDRKKVAPADYCREEIDRDNRPSLQPDAERVKGWLRRGASLVVNYIDTLTPEMAAVADAIEGRLGGKSQSNLYCSWQQHQAFDTHMDTHDVFALHIAGEKDWRLYEGRLDNAIAHDMFKSLDHEFHQKNCGEVQTALTLRPGDFLYIPRGQYHDALASSDACIHLTFGVTRIIGYDLLNMVFNHAMADSGFRTNFPLPNADPAADRGAVRQHIETLADRLVDIVRSDAVLDDMVRYREAFKYWRGGFDLPGDAIAETAAVGFALTSDDFSIVRANGRTGLKSPRGVLPIPAGIEDAVTWVVGRQRFTRAELAAAFSDMSDAGREKLLADLSSMRVIGPG